MAGKFYENVSTYGERGKTVGKSVCKKFIKSSASLITPYEQTRAGFVALAIEKNRRATPHVAEARALQEAASQARTPTELLKIKLLGKF